jgi:two-component system chemotaxis sensor kinase CheA
LTKEIDITKYSKLFVSEARESLRIMSDSMLELEKNPSDKERIDQVFRACHSIKGMAAMMSMKEIADTTHALEDVLSAVREGTVEPTDDVAQTIFNCIDTLDSMVSAVESSTPINEDHVLIEQLKAVLSGIPKKPPIKKKTMDERPAKRDANQKKTVSIKIKLGRRCSLPSARALVILRELAKASEIEQTNPTEEEIEREHMFEDMTVVVVPGERFTEAVRRVAAMTDVDEVLVGSTDEPREKWTRLAKPDNAAAMSSPEASLQQNVRVGMDKLDDLLDNVGELVIGRSRLQEKAAAHEDYELQEISTLIDKLTFDIQSRVLGIRMIRLDTVMSRFPRMVRDISKAEGKDVELVVESGSIELDRTVVDKISEPLLHLFRNCIDHGIEPVEERLRLGKRPKGLIRIVASKQQDHVLIEISDDGRGIDLDSVRKVAITKGIMTKEQSEAASGRELTDLLFRPGFTTATEITEVSGRGVGLDVVKRNVEDLGGTVMVNTSKGAGSTFSLWLPFTLAIIEAMLVGVADQTYAIPMGTIVETHRYETGDIKTIRGREVVQLRGEVLPLVRMREFFGVEDEQTKSGINTLIVQSRDRRAALVVDELSGHQQIVVKSLDHRLRKVRGISGGTILGSGKIALILDVDSILGE